MKLIKLLRINNKEVCPYQAADVWIRVKDISEPLFHVNAKLFKEEMKLAKDSGFIVERGRRFSSVGQWFYLLIRRIINQ